ncbi:neuralized-like protein 4 [Aplysia californica]|uniref:Neuralized-like protein 4 n=1 Tax=Aplysia californica TaxID=6500 RepID=A0ABM0JYE3_APLCA|nr:neuralized-like protein 4 [Aplysia californica]
MATPVPLPSFHTRTGSLVALSNNNRTAQRNHPTQEFNNGVVLSAEPLQDNQVFEVKIDRKVNSWSGSIEIGVTVCEPSNLNFPFSATGFRDGTWVMSGMSILCEGHSLVEDYGCDLDQLTEGDRVGVMRSPEGALHFYVNGVDQGMAATGIPSQVYAVIDLYGKCAQVSVCKPTQVAERENVHLNNDLTNEMAQEFLAEISNQIANDLAAERDGSGSDDERGPRDTLRFHERCGNLVKLSNNRRSAERERPLDEFNNGVVMTNRPIRDNEIFEIQLDRLVDKWSGSIEVGITTHNPNTLDFPATMTNMRNASASRTIMMSGCGILTNGKGTRREYGQFNLDELSEGDRIGLVRKSNGHLHYFINGLDQGMASSNSPSPVWGVVDLYGMAVKVSIVDHTPVDPPETASATAAGTSSSLPAQPAERSLGNMLRQFLDSCDGGDRADSQAGTETEEVEKLLFSPVCGVNAAVINGNKTAHRPNATEDFNNGVILTNRILRPNEVFEVRLDRLVEKWAGSVEIGLTTHQPGELDFPSTMTNIRSGTWMMTGNGVMHNGSTVIEDYGQNLDRLKVGDRVGVVRKQDGTVHFFVNSVDQGACAANVPATVYGVIDLYGQAAQATIVDISDALTSPDTDSSVFTDPDQLKFHTRHGRNAAVLHSGLTAARPNATGEFNDAIIMSNRPLRDGELFEVVIEKMVDRWSGSLEAGVTLVKPEDIDFPSTMTDIEHDTWMLSGSAIMQDGATIRNGYPLDLDSLTIGSRVGMMRCSDGTLHYFLDGVDQGVASADIAPGVYAVIDLYGQCGQVSMSCGTIVMPPAHLLPQPASLHTEPLSTPSVANTEVTHRLSKCCGKNITLRSTCWGASRVQGYNHGIVFSSEPLKYDEIFEVEVSEVSAQWSGSLKIGLTTMAISDSSSPVNIPATADEITSKVTWVVVGSEVKKNGVVVKDNYAPSLARLQVGDRLGVCRDSDGAMHVLLNGDDLGEAASGIPKNVFAVVDIHGCVEGVVVISSCSVDSTSISLSPAVETELTAPDRDQDSDTSAHLTTCFHGNHGKNVLLREGGKQAERLTSYNHGMVVGNRPLKRRTLFQVKLGRLNKKWTSSLMIGIVGFPVDKFTFPISASLIWKPCVVIQGEAVFVSGFKVKDHYGPNLDTLGENCRVGVVVDEDSCLHLVVNGIDYGVAVRDVPHPCWPLVDLYGQCEQVVILPEDLENPAVTGVKEECEKADLENKGKEKSSSGVDNGQTVRHCEYLNICNRFRASLALPDGYFEGPPSCFCSACHKARGDDPHHQRGDPPKDFVLPVGWCRYLLRAPNKAHALNVADKWHCAYHGSRISEVRRSLDTFDLLPSDEGSSSVSSSSSSSSLSILLPRPLPYTEKSRPENLGGKQIFLSPTIRHAGGNQFSPKHRFTDPKTRKSYEARTAFQVWVKPGSYKVSPQYQEDKARVDPHFKNSEIDWVTKERGSTLLHALLVRVE